MKLKLIFEFVKKYYPFILFVMVVVLALLLVQTNNSLKRERALREYQENQYNQNFSALKDSIKVEFNKKLKAWEYSKDNYVVQKLADLEKYNKSLANELKKVKGDVIAAIRTQVQGDLGGVTTASGAYVINENTNLFGIKFSTEYQDAGFEQKLSGMSRFYVMPDIMNNKWLVNADSTVIDTNLTTINVTYGFRELDNKYQVFAVTPSSKIKLNDITGGFFIDKAPKPLPEIPKRWGLGPYVGYGISTATDLKTPRFGWNFGVALHYDLIQFSTPKWLKK